MIGQTISHYKIIEKLGGGGMGVAYMSPEQTRGAEVDHRTDLWALGVVLYEMITGQLPFKGEYEQAVMYSIVNETPIAVAALRAETPPDLENIVNKCLEKNPANRFQRCDELLNETEEKELNGLSGMLITSLEQSRRLSVLTRSRMFDIFKQMGKQEVDRIDEALGKEICRQTNVNAMVIATIRKFGRLYTIDLQVLDPLKNEFLFTAQEKDEGQESIPTLIDKLSERTRRGLNEQTAEIRAASQKVAEVTTVNLAAYQYYFKGEELVNKLKLEEARKEFNQAIALDSTFGLAYYRLAYVLGWNLYEQANEPIRKAMQYINSVPKKEQYLIRAFFFDGDDPIDFEDADSTLHFFFPKDYARAVNDSAGFAAPISVKRMFYSQAGKDYMLVGVPWGWVNSAPVGDLIIDPSVLPVASEDVWLENAGNNGASTILLVGKARTPTVNYPKKRTIIKFNTSSVPPTATVLNAQLKLRYYAAVRPTGSTDPWVDRWVQAHQLLRHWKEMEADSLRRLSGVNWLAPRGKIGPGSDSTMVDANGQYESKMLFWQSETSTLPMWKNWDLTNLTQKWVNGTATNYGVILWATNEDVNGYDLRFYSSEAAQDQANWRSLISSKPSLFTL